MTNAHSILPELDELYLITSCVKIDVCIITESWLHEEVDDDLLRLNNSAIFRSDRLGRRVGSVCIGANSYLNPILVLTSSPAPLYYMLTFLLFKLFYLLLFVYHLLCFIVRSSQPICSANHDLRSSFLTNEIDKILAAQSNVKLVVAGDL